MSNYSLKNIESHGTVEKKIHGIVDGMGADVEYFFMNWAQANVAIDDVEKPTIVYVLPPSGEFNVGWAQVKDKPDAQIAFIAPTDFDFEGEGNDDIIEQMKRLCVRFIKAFNESGLFEAIEGKLPYRVLYDYLDRNVTGIVITPHIKEEEGIIICGSDEARTEDVLEEKPAEPAEPEEPVVEEPTEEPVENGGD